MRTAPVLVLLAACRPPPPEADDCVPVALAGPDVAGEVGAEVVLDGAAEACGDAPVAFGWSLARAPEASALDDSAFTTSDATTSFVPDAPGEYAVGLIVSQDGVASNPDLALVRVGSSALPPVADAGDDVSGRVGARAILDGSASYDPDGAPLAFRWSIASLPTGSALDTLWDAHTAGPSFVPDAPGTYVLALAVDDGSSTSSVDYASVDAAPDDRAPVADAGPSRTLPACESDLFVLDASGSWDPDGDALTYAWGLLDAPDGSATTDATIADRAAPRTTFAPDVDGTYTFWLEVDDGLVPSPKDLVALTTGAANAAPVADAGQDQTVVNARADCVTTDEGPRCEPCPVVRYRLDGSGSTDADGDTLRYRWDVPDALRVTDPTAGAIDVWTPTDLVPDSGETLRVSWTLGLAVADCAEVAEDTVTITLECRGDPP